MHPTPDFVALIQREREAEIREDALARLASRVRACCNPSLFKRLVAAFCGTSAAC